MTVSARVIPSKPLPVQTPPDLRTAGSRIRQESTEVPRMKDERRSFTPLERHDLSQDEPMVTGRLYRVHPAVQATQRTRHMGWLWIGTPIDVDFELLATPAGEVQGEIALVVTEHMDRERRSRSECRQARALMGETPQYQRRIERD